MIDSLAIGALTVAGASTGAVLLRDVVNRAALKKACGNATVDVEKFRKENTYTISLKQESRALAIVLYATIGSSRRMRDEIIARWEGKQLPDVEIPLELPELERLMADNQALFIKTLKGSYSHKLKSLLKEQVKRKIHLAKEAAKRAALSEMGAAATNVADARTGSDELNKLYEAIANYVGPELTAFEQGIVHIMDELGLITVTTVLVGKIDTLLHDYLGEAASHFLHGTIDWLDSIYDVPAATFALKSVFREFTMLMNDETSFQDAIFNMGCAVAIKAVAVKIGGIIGASLDGMTLGLSSGIFTVGMSYVATQISNWITEEYNKGLQKELKKLEDEIEACGKNVLSTINTAVKEFNKEFIQRINACPDINDEISLKEFIEEIKEVYSQGYERAERTLSDNTKKAIESLPENSWKHKLLFIDPRKAVKKLYLEEQRTITSYHSGLVHNLTLAAEMHAEEGIGFLIRDVVFDTPETEAALKKIETVIQTCAENYSQSLSIWEEEIIAFRKAGIEKIAVIVERERTYYERFIAERKPLMLKLLKRIKANNKRQGKVSPK